MSPHLLNSPWLCPQSRLACSLPQRCGNLTQNAYRGLANRAPIRLAIAFCLVSVFLLFFRFYLLWSVSSILFPLEEGCGEPWFPAPHSYRPSGRTYLHFVLLCVTIKSMQKFPDKSGQFSGHGNESFVALEFAAHQFFKARVQSILGPPAHFFNLARLSLLSFGELFTHFGRIRVMLSAFD